MFSRQSPSPRYQEPPRRDRQLHIEGKGIGEGVQDYLDVDCIHCYEGARPRFTTLPGDRFDGLIWKGLQCQELSTPTS